MTSGSGAASAALFSSFFSHEETNNNTASTDAAWKSVEYLVRVDESAGMDPSSFTIRSIGDVRDVAQERAVYVNLALALNHTPE
jgi:hypothetical protein